MTKLDGTPYQRLLSYKPPDLDCQVLPGMQGQLWIDQKTFQGAKITSQVIHPVSIEGFLAQVEPGTRFELEKAAVANSIWLPSHFEMKSHARVLFLVSRSSNANETYCGYIKANTSEHIVSEPATLPGDVATRQAGHNPNYFNECAC